MFSKEKKNSSLKNQVSHLKLFLKLTCSENSQNYEIFKLCVECAIFKL